MKIAFITIVLILLATSEVAVTGTLYDRLGLHELVFIYVITTSAGALILLSQSKTMKRISKEISRRVKNDQLFDELQAQLNIHKKSKMVREWGTLTTQGGLYSVAWVLVLIPGVVTDIAGFGLIGIWFLRRNNVSNIL